MRELPCTWIDRMVPPDSAGSEDGRCRMLPRRAGWWRTPAPVAWSEAGAGTWAGASWAAAAAATGSRQTDASRAERLPNKATHPPELLSEAAAPDGGPPLARRPTRRHRTMTKSGGSTRWRGATRIPSPCASALPRPPHPGGSSDHVAEPAEQAELGQVVDGGEQEHAGDQGEAGAEARFLHAARHRPAAQGLDGVEHQPSRHRGSAPAAGSPCRG